MFNSISTAHSVPLKSCMLCHLARKNHTFYSNVVFEEWDLQILCFYPLCSAQRKNTRGKWKPLEYGKNWLLIPNCLIWITASENVFSTTYSWHRNGIARTSTGRITLRGMAGRLSSGDWRLKGEGLGLVLEWSWLGQARVTPVSVLGDAMLGGLLVSSHLCYPRSWPYPTPVLAT